MRKPAKYDTETPAKAVTCDNHDNLTHPFISDSADKDSMNDPQGNLEQKDLNNISLFQKLS